MKKTGTKKAASPKKSKEVAKKTHAQAVKKETLKAGKESIYPKWTTPEHLSGKDHKDLQSFYELFISGKTISAFRFASNFDTLVRDAIPPEIWEQAKGTQTSEKEEPSDNTQESQNEKSGQKSSSENPGHKQGRFFILKNDVLQLLPEEYFNSGNEIIESRFNDKTELEELLAANCKSLLGENTVMVIAEETKDEYFPKVLLLDFKDQLKPRLYLVETILPAENFGTTYARITHYLFYLKNKQKQNDFLYHLQEIIESNHEAKQQLQERLSAEQDITGILSGTLDNKPAILLITDEEKTDLQLMQQTYVDTWGKMVRQLIIKKFTCNDDLILSVEPEFVEIWKNDKPTKAGIEKCTEEDHLMAVAGNVKEIYQTIKTALLETDSSLEFNVKKHYISLRKDKNLAFFQLQKKKLNLVVINPEEDTRMSILDYQVKSLPASVQKFWNGPCATVVIDDIECIKQVIFLLKKIIEKA